MKEMPLLYEGSVKDIRGVKNQSPYLFVYSNRYSVFDWGQMPDDVPYKGEVLATMARLFFDLMGGAKQWRNWKPSPEVEKLFTQNSSLKNLFLKLQEKGVPHHLLSADHSEAKGSAIAGKAPGSDGSPTTGSSFAKSHSSEKNVVAVQPVQVIRPSSSQKEGALKWDYAGYQSKPVQTLVPLEVIFRFGVPEGSSLLKRADWPGYLKELGLQEKPRVGDTFTHPLIEFSTKLEPSDRNIRHSEAQTIAGLSESEFKHLIHLTTLLALRLKDIFAQIGVELWDGKFEFAFISEGSQRGFMLVDSIGPDELRLIYKNFQISKEFLRKCYRGTTWYDAVDKAKHLAEQRGEKDWKKVCLEELKEKPLPLPTHHIEIFSQMYRALTNALCQQFYHQVHFPSSWNLERVAEEIQKSGISSSKN